MNCEQLTKRRDVPTRPRLYAYQVFIVCEKRKTKGPFFTSTELIGISKIRIFDEIVSEILAF